MIMLKATSRKAMDAQLKELGLLVQVGDELTPARRVSVTGYKGAIIPTIWKTKPVYDADGNVTEAGVAVRGYHCNVLDNAGIIKDPTPYHEDTNPGGTDWGLVKWIDPETVNTPAHRF